jgi:hypothetical protein
MKMNNSCCWFVLMPSKVLILLCLHLLCVDGGALLVGLGQIALLLALLFRLFRSLGGRFGRLGLDHLLFGLGFAFALQEAGDEGKNEVELEGAHNAQTDKATLGFVGVADAVEQGDDGQDEGEEASGDEQQFVDDVH